MIHLVILWFYKCGKTHAHFKNDRQTFQGCEIEKRHLEEEKKLKRAIGFNFKQMQKKQLSI